MEIEIKLQHDVADYEEAIPALLEEAGPLEQDGVVEYFRILASEELEDKLHRIYEEADREEGETYGKEFWEYRKASRIYLAAVERSVKTAIGHLVDRGDITIDDEWILSNTGGGVYG